MRKGIVLGLLATTAALACASAQAHVDLSIGFGWPVVVAPPVYAPAPVYAPPPVYVEPRPVIVERGYYYDDWQARAWREQQWREQRWREHQWRERHRQWHRWHDDDD